MNVFYGLTRYGGYCIYLCEFSCIYCSPSGRKSFLTPKNPPALHHNEKVLLK